MKIRSYLEESPLFAITKAARMLEAGLSRSLDCGEMGFLQGLALVAVFLEEPAMASPSQLADSFFTTRGNMSHCLSALEAQRLVKRRIDPDDARSYRIAITPDGKKCAMRLVRVFDGIQRRIEEELGTRDVRWLLAGISGIERLCTSLPPGTVSRKAAPRAQPR